MSKKNGTAKILKQIKTQLEEQGKVESEQDPYMLMDASDDEQILSEIEGKASAAVDNWVYIFFDKTTNKEVRGLSWVGTKNMVYYLRRKKQLNLTVDDVTYMPDPNDPKYVLFKAKVRDLISGAVSFGVKRQGLMMKLKDGKEVANNFWYEQGFSKAKRNAFQDFLPADVIAEWISKWIKEGKFKKLKPTQQQASLSEGQYKNITPYMQLIATAGNPEVLQNIADQLNKQTKKFNAKEIAYLKRAFTVRKEQLENEATKKNS